MKLLIIGGVAGGASAAAKARRVNEEAEIILFERGEYISFANCGLPYHVGEVIQERDNLLVMTPDAFNARFRIDVRISQEVVAINRQRKTLSIRKIKSDETYEESYDKLIIATGAHPHVPEIPGVDLPQVHTLWTIPDMDAVKKWVDKGAKHAVVAGGGFIGVESAENLRKRGVETVLLQRRNQIMPQVDPEIAKPLADEMRMNGVDLRFKNELVEIKKSDSPDTVVAVLKDGTELETNLVILALGARPNSQLAEKSGLKLGAKKSIEVDEHLLTSDPDIYAVGDVVQVTHLPIEQPSMIPFAGPANRQGRAAAINVFGGKETYRGTFGTLICKIFDLTVAATGATEKLLKDMEVPYKKAYFHPQSHAGYYPGASGMYVKILFNDEGKILGAQVVGEKGVDKRIDVIATAMQAGMPVQDLSELELAYAPPYGSAKDPVNYAGFIASNILSGDSIVTHPDEIPDDAFLLDVRQPEEVDIGAIPGATNIPLGQLRQRLDELPKDKEIVTYCKVGLRGYIAEKILRHNGFKVSNLSGGIMFWKLFNDKTPPSAPAKKIQKLETTMKENSTPNTIVELDACGMQCPGPIVSVKKKMETLESGESLKVRATDAGFMNDLPAWCESTGNTLLSIEKNSGVIEAVVQKGSGSSHAAGSPSCSIQASSSGNVNSEKRTTLVLFSNDLDKTMAAFIIATGFVSLGHKVSIFCTFWGLNVLRKDHPPAVSKDILSKMFGWMMPCGAKKLALSKMHMMGMGTAMMKHVMSTKNIDDLPTLIKQAREMGVELLACEMAMNVMGIQLEELMDGVKTAGVANFAALSEKSATTLFI